MRKIFVVTDYACNSRCLSCAKRVDETGRLSLDDIVQRLERVRPTSADVVELSGGEPTLRPDLVKLIEVSAAFGSDVVLLSNSRRFKDGGLARSVQEAGVARVMTTLYSHVPAEHDAITQAPGSFDEALRGLATLASLGVNISVKTIVLRSNYQSLPEFVRFASRTFPTAWLSIHGLILRGAAHTNRDTLSARVSQVAPGIERALDVARELGTNLGVFIVPTCSIDPFYWRYLSAGWRKIAREMVYLSPAETVVGNLDVSLPDFCAGCRVSEHCSWAWESAWREYVALHGTDELRRVMALGP